MRRHDLPLWQDRVRTAPTPRHVVVLANEFLQSLAAGDRLFLPEACKPRPLDTAADLAAYAYDVKATHDARTSDAQEAVKYVSTVMVEACQRIAEITGPHRVIKPLKRPSSP